MSKRRHRRSRAKDWSGLPKGAYRLPDGNYVTIGRPGSPSKRGRSITITAVHHAEPDAKKVAQVLLAFIEGRQGENAPSGGSIHSRTR